MLPETELFAPEQVRVYTVSEDGETTAKPDVGTIPEKLESLVSFDAVQDVVFRELQVSIRESPKRITVDDAVKSSSGSPCDMGHPPAGAGIISLA